MAFQCMMDGGRFARTNARGLKNRHLSVRSQGVPLSVFIEEPFSSFPIQPPLHHLLPKGDGGLLKERMTKLRNDQQQRIQE